MIQEFKKFISRGNVLDLAIGVIIGGAFSSIVSSLVNNIFTPLLGIILGGKDFSNLSITVGDAKIMYGAFIQSIIDFLLIAICLFIFVKVLNNINDGFKKIGNKNKKGTEEVAPVKKSDDIILLEEIRDLLKENKKGSKK